MKEGDEDAGSTAEKVARRSYGKLVALLASRSGDVAGAEDALGEAFAAALRSWPATGTPQNPEAWLLSVARRRQTDDVRRKATGRQSEQHLTMLSEELEASQQESDSGIPDHRLALMFACAHPALDANVRTALILQTVLGFDAKAIAEAFLVSPAAMSQRLVRAKAKIKHARISLSIPDKDALSDRLDHVLDAVYACFTAGWSDLSSPESKSNELSGEALWLGRLIVELLPYNPASLGLLALMLFADARLPARRATDGSFVPLAEQDTKLWNETKIEEANLLLRRALTYRSLERFQLMAAIQSAHVARRWTGRTDWPAIVVLYEALYSQTGSSVVAVNRAMAIGEDQGSSAGLKALAQAEDDPAVFQYQPYWAAKAELLGRAGETHGLQDAFAAAIALAEDGAVRRYLEQRRQYHLDRSEHAKSRLSGLEQHPPAIVAQGE